MKQKKLSVLERAKDMNDMLMLGDEFVVADIETTALSPEKGGMIIEIGAVKIKGTEIIDTFSALINPERKIYSKTTELTGITNEMVQDQPSYGHVLPEFYRFLGNSIFVAHNSDFDWNRYLMHFLPKVGIYPTNKVIDTLALSKLYFPNNEKHKLDIMCGMFNISLENHHRALDDSMATAELLIEFKKNFATKLFKQTYALEAEQMDLFNLALDTTGTSPLLTSMDSEKNINPGKESEQATKTYKIKRVKYWEKDVAQRKCLRRLYVTLEEGTAFLDMNTRNWYNKDIKETIDFELLQNTALRHLQLKNMDDLCNYRQ